MPKPNSRKILTIAIHIAGWGILFGFPFFFAQGRQEGIDWNRYISYCFMPLAFMLVFYLNYFVLIDRFLFRRQWALFFGINLVLIVSAALLIHFWHEFFVVHGAAGGGVKELAEGVKKGGPPRRKPGSFPFVLFLMRDCMSMALTIALSVAIRMTGNWHRIDAEKREIEKERTAAELKNLRSQLNPHFLFNTLNNIYSLIAVNPDKAQYAVHSLSGLLRYVLYENNQNFVPLEKELAFIRSYVELMQLRLPARTELHVTLPEKDGGLRVAPLLFVTLIENAFKHGVSSEEASFIHIRIEVTEAREVICQIENSNFPKTDTDRSGSGIGIENLRKRLQLVYPGRHVLKTRQSGCAYISQLIIKGEEDGAELRDRG